MEIQKLSQPDKKETPAENSSDEPIKAFQKSVDEFLLSEKAFERIPAIQSIRAKWEALGLHREDPVFLLIEVLGLFEARHRQLSKNMVDVFRASSELSLYLHEEVSRAVAQTLELQKTLQTSQEQTKSLNTQNGSLIKVNERFIDALPKIHEQIFVAVQTLDDHGIWSKAIYIGSLAAAIIIGIIIGKHF